VQAGDNRRIRIESVDVDRYRAVLAEGDSRRANHRLSNQGFRTAPTR